MRLLAHAFRIYTTPAQLDDIVRFHEDLQGVACERRLVIAETDVAVAKVGAFLILAREGGFPDSVRRVGAIFYVDDLDASIAWAVAQGAEVLRAVQTVTGGRNANLRNPDGLVVEYFEARDD